MTTTIISNTPSLGLLTNRMVAGLFTVNEAVNRINEAVSTASSGYTGTAGTEFEGDATLFGVVASDVPGAKGSDYSFAVGNLANAWATFWSAALSSIQEIDNGVTLP
jgi:hypothetical protein